MASNKLIKNKNKEEIFSVLMSLYHKELPEYLDLCLSSLLSQTLLASQIVIVFDGEVGHDLEKIVSKFIRNLPIKIVKLPNNVGLGKALNEGLKYCSNEWIFRMDTDDICLPDRFEKQVAFIRENPDVALVGGQIEEFEETMSCSTGKRLVPTEYQAICQKALKTNPFNHMTVAYKKSAILDAGGYQHHLFMEDYNLWLRMIAKGNLVRNLPDILVNVRAGSAMHSRRKGLNYIKSEYDLAQLKYRLGLQSKIMAQSYFILRAIPRLFPNFILRTIYNFLRGKQ